MAELSLKQITDKLNSGFTSEGRKLVFWYDVNAEFAEDVDTLALENAKVWHLEPDNQFYTKYFLECVDTTTNYLVYAPFAKPAIGENHLADTIKYSKEFFADRASLLTVDLGIDERLKPVIQHYIKFFGDKKRTRAFYDLDAELYNRSSIEVALMSVLCKCKVASFEEVVRTVLTDTVDEAGGEANSVLAEFAKYDLLEAFWNQAQDVFGYGDGQPTLEKFVMTLFVTYADKVISVPLPKAWQAFLSNKPGNVLAFMDQMMNSTVYGEHFDALSEHVYKVLKAEDALRQLPIEALVKCGVFAGVDALLIEWMTERLEMEDVAAKLGEQTIPQIVKARRQGHFGQGYRAAYFVLQNAWHLISGMQYVSSNSMSDLVARYTDEWYKMDRYYRYFYYYLDQLEDAAKFEQLTALVENIYANDYLSKVCANWNERLSEECHSITIAKQPAFYDRYVKYSKEQLVVIISDALRYEVGMSLFEKLQADEKCTTEMQTMASTLPSITSYGMAALLPHSVLELTDDYKVMVDGKKTDTLEQRQVVLQDYKPASKCVQFDDLKMMRKAELRNVFTRQDVVYVYHNQIDARGDKANTENEVFNACEEAVNEIASLIQRLTVSANRSHFIVTADHGFLYRRNKLSESDKIASVSGAADVVGRRYLLSDDAVEVEGVASTAVGTMMQNKDQRMVSYPIGADIFKAPGAGHNYVHGGSSPQEMIIPVIKVKTARGYKETTHAEIALVSRVSKITNLITSLDFMQTEAISDVVKETIYRIYFEDESGEKISNEHFYKADKKEAEALNRVFRLRFSFKNKKYNKEQKYYLVAYDDNRSLEVLRHEIVMDIAFADDFGFGF